MIIKSFAFKLGTGEVIEGRGARTATAAKPNWTNRIRNSSALANFTRYFGWGLT